MKDNLDNCLGLTFNHEEGYVNHPKDPGGPTNWGVTLATLAAYRGKKVTAQDVRNLSKGEAKKILVDMYWKTIGGDDLPKGLDYAVFDFGVNSGPARAVKELQKLIDAAPIDGVLGPKTAALIRQQNQTSLIKRYCDARLAYCQKLTTWGTFGRGWTRRITGKDPKGIFAPQLGVVGESLAMLAGKTPRGIDSAAGTTAVGAGKARDVDRGVTTIAGAVPKLGALAAGVAAAAEQVATTLAPGVDYLPLIGKVLAAVVVVGIVAGVIVDITKLRGAGTDA